MLATSCSIIRRQVAMFPGNHSIVVSPNKALWIRNVDADSDEDVHKLGDSHALFLGKRGLKLEEKIYTYGRYVYVSWSPKSDFCAITDFDGSNHAGCQVFYVRENSFINIEDAIRKAYSSHSDVLTGSHIYFTAKQWISDTQLEIQVEAYDFLENPRPRITVSYIYNLLDQSVLIK
jgi:hypothetical protein